MVLNDDEDLDNCCLVVHTEHLQMWKKLEKLVNKDAQCQKSGSTTTKNLGANRAKKLLETFIGHAKAEGCISDGSYMSTGEESDSSDG